MAKKGKMTDHQKVWEAYSVHQDNLFWSRTQTLFAIQAGVLAGSYVTKGAFWLAVPLLLLGVLLTALLWYAANRDQKHRNQAFKKSRVPPVRDPPEQVGRKLMNVVFGLLLLADLWMLGWILWRHGFRVVQC